MQVPFPRGPSCSAECFHSKTQDYPPAYIARSVTESLVRELHGKYFGAMFEIYQCPACGARVVFREYEGRNGRVRERLGHHLG